MQVLRSIEQLYIAPVGLNIRVMMVSADQAGCGLYNRLAQLGGLIDANLDLFTGLEAVIDDPSGYGLLVAIEASTGKIRWRQRLEATGSGTPMTVMNPFLAINFSIALQGIFPSRN